MSKNTEAMGAAAAKTGRMATPLDRHKGFSSTMDAMGSKTRTQYPHMDKHYQYEDVGGTNNGCCNERGQHG